MSTPDDKWIRAEAETLVREDGAEHDYDYKAGWHRLLQERNAWIKWANAMLSAIDPKLQYLPEGDPKRAKLSALLKGIRAERWLTIVERPRIICLCGSTRFVETWISEYQRLSDEGNIVLTVARMPPRPNLQYDEPELKARLDRLHKYKIALADEVFVLNVDGYIGESTRSEIAHAIALDKPVTYLEPLPAPLERKEALL